VSYQAMVYRVLIASPSDVPEERRSIPEVIHGWNDLHSVDKAVDLLPVKWETHATPEMGDRPQAIINNQGPSVIFSVRIGGSSVSLCSDKWRDFFRALWRSPKGKEERSGIAPQLSGSRRRGRHPFFQSSLPTPP